MPTPSAKTPPPPPPRGRPFLAQIFPIGDVALNGLSTKYQDDFNDGFIVNHLQHYLRPEEYAEAIGLINASLPEEWSRASSCLSICWRWSCCLPREVVDAERRLQQALDRVNALPHMQQRQLQWELCRAASTRLRRCAEPPWTWLEVTKHPDARFPVLYDHTKREPIVAKHQEASVPGNKEQKAL